MLRSRLFHIAIFCSGRDQRGSPPPDEPPLTRQLLRHGERLGG